MEAQAIPREGPPYLSVVEGTTSTLPVFEHRVLHPRSINVEDRPLSHGNGTCFRYEVEMTDHSVQEAKLLMPDELQSDILVNVNLPWVISQRGLMRAFGEKLAEKGIASVSFAPDGSLKPSVSEDEAPPAISLFRTAYNQHRMLDALLPKHKELNKKKLISVGPSKGAAESFAMGTDAYVGRRRPVYIDGIAPAPALSYGKKQLEELAKVLPGEIVATLGYVASRSIRPDFWRHERKTIELSSAFLRSVVRTVPTLFNGDPAESFRALNPDIPVHVDIHGQDQGCTPQEWQGLVQARPNTTTNYLPKLRHMHIPERLPFALARIETVIEESNGGRDFSRVDFERVAAAAPVKPSRLIAFPGTRLLPKAA